MSPSSVPPILLPLSLAATSASASESSADQVLGPEPPSFAAAPHTDASAFHLASAHAVQNASSAQGSAGHGGATTEPVCTVHGHGDASPTWQHLHRKCPPISASAILSLLLPTYHETIGRPLHMTPAQAFDHLEPFIPNIAFPEAYSRFTYVDQADMDSWVHDLESVQKVQYDCRAGGGRQAVHSSATQTIVAGAASGDGAVLTSPSNPTRRSKRIAMRAESANAGTPHGFPSDHATSTLDRTKRFRHDHSYSRHTLNT
ncbi:hypothetical protein BC831DRAFT_48986 [Entophlyctis helioformis]|nr:hypothetical protein BC831DRAFT_48986 [Entophlyctis helioformis]